MNKGELTKAKMIGVTGALMRKRGYFGTGLNEILSESQAPKGSVYFHFPGGKDELAAAALKESAAMWRTKLLAVLEAQPADPFQDIQAVCHALATELESSAFKNGCPLATVTLEVAAENEALRAVSAESYKSWETLIAGRLRAGGIPAELTASLASLVLSSMEGALLLARAYHDTGPLTNIPIAFGKTLVLLAQGGGRTRRGSG